jgi:hypothetical protein
MANSSTLKWIKVIWMKEEKTWINRLWTHNIKIQECLHQDILVVEMINHIWANMIYKSKVIFLENLFLKKMMMIFLLNSVKIN